MDHRARRLCLCQCDCKRVRAPHTYTIFFFLVRTHTHVASPRLYGIYKSSGNRPYSQAHSRHDEQAQHEIFMSVYCRPSTNRVRSVIIRIRTKCCAANVGYMENVKHYSEKGHQVHSFI